MDVSMIENPMSPLLPFEEFISKNLRTNKFWKQTKKSPSIGW